jgi:hypothetical protein
MSALPPKADIADHDCDVRFVPKADSCTAAKCFLFEHLVGAFYQWGLTETKRLGSFEVDDEIEFRRLQGRKISRPLASAYWH